jgi:hypothetical protein
MTEEEIEYRVAEIRANFAFEGMELTPEEIQNCRDVLSGKANADELISKRLAHLEERGKHDRARD